MNQELVRIVENIARDKKIDKEYIFGDLEEAMISAIRKHFGDPEADISVQIDRISGKVAAFKGQEAIDIRDLGRIPAQTAKQVMIQRIRADERDSIYTEFVQRKGEIISGSVVRYEGGTLIVNLNHERNNYNLRTAENLCHKSHKRDETRRQQYCYN